MDFPELRDVEEDEPFRKKKRPGCILGLVRLSLALLAPLLLIAALLPTLLSSDPGRRWALKKINAAIAPSEFAVQQWSLGWITPPVLEKVSFSDAAHGVEASIAELQFDRGLLRLLPVGTLNLGSVTLKNPTVSASLAPPPQQPKPPAEEKKAGTGGAFFLPIVDAAVTLTVENGRIQVTGNAPDPFEAQQVSATVELTSYRKPIAVQTQMKICGGTLALEGRVQSPKELFQGEAFEEPERLTLKLVGVDLAALGPLIQHACGEPWIRSGTAEGALTGVIVGPKEFKVEGGLLVNGLSLAAGRQAPSPKADLALMVNVGVADSVVSVTQFELSSPWLRANANGTLQQGSKAGVMIGTISAQAQADLAAVARDFAPALGLSKGFSMRQGQLQAAIELTGDENAMGVEANVTSSNLDMTVDGEPLALKPAPSLVFKAKFPYDQWPEVETFRLKAPFADLYGSGRFDAAVVKGKLDLTRFSHDFKRMLKSAPPMVGSAYLDMATRRDEGRVAVTAFLKLSDVAAELKPGQRMAVPQGTLKAEGYMPLKEGKPENEIQDASFEFTLESGKVSGGWKRLAPPQANRLLVLRGFTLTGNMDLGSVRRLLGGFIPAPVQRRMSEWQGNVVANATAEAAGGVMKARMNAAGQQIVAGIDGGVWRIPDIRLEGALTQGGQKEQTQVEATVTGSGGLERDGEIVYAENAARLGVEALVAADGERLQIKKMDLTSRLFEVQAQADVTELSTRCVVAAKGSAAIDFVAVTHLLAAKGIDEFQLTGRALREFQFESPVAGGLATLFAEGTFNGAAFVGSLKGLGLNAGPANATFKLSKGRLQMAYEPELNGGKLRFVPEITSERGATALSFPAQTRLLENVQINQDMVDTLLVNLNPLFQGSLVQDGSVSLDFRSCHLVSGLAPDKGVAADMDIQFSNLKLQLGPSLRDLLSMLKVKDLNYSVAKLPIHVVVKEGRIWVDPITMVIDKQPVTFSGWVAFNGAIKYLIEVPLTDRLTGGTGGKLLKGQTIRIPVTGTVNAPRLDTSVLQNTLGTLIKNAVGEHAAEKVGSFLEKLQEELKK